MLWFQRRIPVKPVKWCVFKATRHVDRYRCQKCGYLTPATKQPVERIHRPCGIHRQKNFYTSSRGLGDTLAKLLYYTSFGRARKKIGCQCGPRQTNLNNLWPYGKSWAWWNKRVRGWFSGEKT